MKNNSLIKLLIFFNLWLLLIAVTHKLTLGAINVIFTSMPVITNSIIFKIIACLSLISVTIASLIIPLVPIVISLKHENKKRIEKNKILQKKEENEIIKELEIKKEISPLNCSYQQTNTINEQTNKKYDLQGPKLTRSRHKKG